MPEENESLIDRVRNSVKNAIDADKDKPESVASNIQDTIREAKEKVETQAAREKAEAEAERLRKQVTELEAEKARAAAAKMAESMSKPKSAPEKPSQGFQTPQNSNYVPPAAQQSAPPAQSSGRTHKVVGGDTLSKIAQHYYGDGSKWPQIFEANRDKISNPDVIHVGQEFVIPELAQATAHSSGRTHTVVGGDTLSKIAKHYYGDASQWKKIYEANRDKIANPDVINVGQVFVIP